MAGAITTLPQHYEISFDGVWREIMAQQTEHRLAGKYLSKNINGNQERFDQMAADESRAAGDKAMFHGVLSCY